ncbi:uncharacterized protein LOC107609646 isoform X3 [Arachis ipaensis]|uniref:uncharacterized protein LOC107609646 isoform X3 n=1 Tax=Arachis ipaensis TaxID=130454 RepID=UPI000A2B063B|nr:uncharacterized protein LOC107609646 isoform X3 [Arachis ipaensis]
MEVDTLSAFEPFSFGDFRLTTSSDYSQLSPNVDPHAPSRAALRVQKVYCSYRTRCRLADSAVVAEELWCGGASSTSIYNFSIFIPSCNSFSNLLKNQIFYFNYYYFCLNFHSFNLPESAASRWSRVRLNASKVGKGLSLDAQAQKLAFQHWIEAELIHAIVMDTTCITITKNGVKRILVNHSSIGLFPGSSLDIRSLHLDSKHLCQITLNLPVNAFASKIAMWIIVLSPFTKYALTMNPLARSLEEFLPHRISSTTWCFMLLRTILVMATHLTGFLIPYYGLVMALIGSLLSTLVNGGEPEEKKVCGRPRKAASQCNTVSGMCSVKLLVCLYEGQKGSCCYACKIKRKCEDRRY